MIIKQKKGIVALIVIMMVFLAAAVFVSVNTQKPVSNAAGNDVKYTIEVRGSGSVTGVIENNERKTFSAGGGIDTMFSAFGEMVIFTPEKHYQFSATVNWSGSGSVRLNRQLQPAPVGDPYTFNDVTDLSIQTSGVQEITITFELKKVSYSISSLARYIENNNISNKNADAASDGAAINLTDDSGQAVTSIELDDYVTISAVKGANQIFYGYALLDTKPEEEDKYKINFKYITEFEDVSENTQITIKLDYDFLDKHLLSSNRIEIIGAFIKTFSVKISDYTSDAYSGNFIQVSITNGLTKYDSGILESGFTGNVAEGSYITITAKNISHFKFEKFNIASSGLDPSSTDKVYTIEYLSADYEISAVFSKKEYFLSFEIQNSFGKVPAGIDEEEIVIEGIDGNKKFSIGDTITIELSDTLLTYLAGHNLYGNIFKIKIGAEYLFEDLSTISETEVTVTESSLQIKVDKNFLDNYLNLNNETIRIIANFSYEYAFSITLSDTTGLGNNYTVSVDNGAATTPEGNYNPSNLFEYGTVITIVLNPANYATYNLGNVYKDSELTGNTIKIVLNNSNRNIAISFILAKFDIKDTTEFEGYKVSSNKAGGSLSDLSIGNVITISIGVADNDEVKKWILKGNGKNLDILNDDLSAYGAEYTSGGLKIVITKEWLDEFGYNINSEVVTGMKTSLLITIITPSIAVPILIIILLIALITNAKRKKFIEAELLDKKMKGYTYNTGSMIEDLRDDSFKKVSKGDIKAEMKKRKGK